MSGLPFVFVDCARLAAAVAAARRYIATSYHRPLTSARTPSSMPIVSPTSESSSSSPPATSRARTSSRTDKRALLDALAAQLKHEKAQAEHWARRMMDVEDEVRALAPLPTLSRSRVRACRLRACQGCTV